MRDSPFERGVQLLKMRALMMASDARPERRRILFEDSLNFKQKFELFNETFFNFLKVSQ